MSRVKLATNVFDAALDRFIHLFEDTKSRVVVAFSAGKDSGVCLDLAIMAAQITGRLPVDVMIRDEEIMFPGTYEYAERVARRPEVRMHWLISNQPIVNVYNRREPYWWVFDPLLPPEKWVRQPPDFAKRLPTMAIEHLVSVDRFPPPHPDGFIYNIIGLRVSESAKRAMGLQASMSYIGMAHKRVKVATPIYDWQDSDIWLAIKQYGWDYNHAYDVMHRLGLPKERLRIAPPTMTAAGASSLALSAKAWPGWFERVAERCPGVRQVALFGLRAIRPQRRAGETWEQTFQRECIDEAPEWIAERSRKIQRHYRHYHARHSNSPLPEEIPCHICGAIGAWRQLTNIMFNGDPFALKTLGILNYVEPEFFRPGAGTWGGKPNWT